MAAGGGSRGKAARGGPVRKRTPAPATGRGSADKRRARTKPHPETPAPAPEEARTFTLGAVPGATPGKWISIWRERMPHVELQLRSVSAAAQCDDLRAGEVDAALVRLPADAADLHVIPLYEEQTVAVVSTDSHLTAADELTLADLAGEVVIVPGDDVIAAVVPDAASPSFDAPADTADAVATVAAGVGVVLAPLSIARAHARKDVETRPVRDAPTSRVGLAWRRDAQTPDVDAFIGIVRGRTANSSR